MQSLVLLMAIAFFISNLRSITIEPWRITLKFRGQATKELPDDHITIGTSAERTLGQSGSERLEKDSASGGNRDK
jgi:hypothetical protein